MLQPSDAGDDENIEMAQLRRRLALVEGQLETLRGESRRWEKLASIVHRTLLARPVRHEAIHVDVRYHPIEAVGGDYCQVRFCGQETCYITLCDVMGHGIVPAFVATRVSSEVRHWILDQQSPSSIVRQLNGFMRTYFQETGLFLSFFAAKIDLVARRITWSGGGHPPAILVRPGTTHVELLESQNALIGVVDDCLDEHPEHSFDLHGGDRVLFYTDGLTETGATSGNELGTGGLAEIATSSMGLDVFRMADDILEKVAKFASGSQEDDKTLIVAEIR